MQKEHARAGGRRSGIIALAMQAMRKASRRRAACIDCPYGGKCLEPDSQGLISADRVDAHVPVAPIMTGQDRR